jgi:hypothetical protein
VSGLHRYAIGVTSIIPTRVRTQLRGLPVDFAGGIRQAPSIRPFVNNAIYESTIEPNAPAIE